MSNLDKAIRAKLALSSPDHPRSWNELAYAKALGDLLDWANGLESDFEGNPSNVGKAFAEQVRTVIATSLGVSGEDRSEPTPAPREWVFGFGPRDAESAWQCRRCHEVMRQNQRACPSCAYTVFDPVYREVVTPEGPAPDRDGAA